jgi:hypothetical protein
MPWGPLAVRGQVFEMEKWQRERAEPERMKPGMLLGRRRNAWFEYLQEGRHKVKKNSQIDE